MGVCFLHGQRLLDSGSGGGEGQGYSLLLDGSLPEAAEEGCVSVDPASFPQGAQASGEYMFSNKPPKPVTEGFLWVRTEVNGLKVNMEKPLSIAMSVADARIYHDGDWCHVHAYIRAEGGWAEFSFEGNGRPEIVPWATGTDQQIAKMVAAMDAGTLSVADTGWQVGDVRRVYYNGIDAYGLAPKISAQYIDLRLVNAGGKTLENGKECHFVVEQKDCLNVEIRMNKTDTNVGGWEASGMRDWCNNAYWKGLPEALLPIFKRFRNVTGPGGGEKSGYTETVDYFALMGMPEVFPNGFDTPEAKVFQKQFKLYADGAAPLKHRGFSGGSVGCWCRTPIDSNNERFGFIFYTGNGSPQYYPASNSSNSCAPIGCI